MDAKRKTFVPVMVDAAITQLKTGKTIKAQMPSAVFFRDGAVKGWAMFSSYIMAERFSLNAGKNMSLPTVIIEALSAESIEGFVKSAMFMQGLHACELPVYLDPEGPLGIVAPPAYKNLVVFVNREFPGSKAFMPLAKIKHILGCTLVAIPSLDGQHYGVIAVGEYDDTSKLMEVYSDAVMSQADPIIHRIGLLGSPSDVFAAGTAWMQQNIPLVREAIRRINEKVRELGHTISGSNHDVGVGGRDDGAGSGIPEKAQPSQG
jgi:hypothetical protein